MKSVEKRLVFCQIDVQDFHLRTVQRYLFYYMQTVAVRIFCAWCKATVSQRLVLMSEASQTHR
jgi:hypothetical protein